MSHVEFFPPNSPASEEEGIRHGARGTHSSRTIMLSELSALSTQAGLGDPKTAILDANVLGKSTQSGRVLTLQRLRELYSFDQTLLLFRIFRALAKQDSGSLPLLALLMALARDPLFRASAGPILGLAPGAQLMRDLVRDAVASSVGARLNDAVLDKVVRNTASSWTQTGHLNGRTIKRRTRVKATPTALALALWLANKAGFRARELFENGWIAALDLDPTAARSMAERAHAAGLIIFRGLGNMFELDLAPLERLAGVG